MKEIENCHCCDGSYNLISETSENMDKEFYKDIYLCNSCGHIFRHYKEDILKYHIEEYREKHEIHNREERLQRISKKLELIKDYISKDLNGLEIGVGDGLFIQQVAPYMNSVYGCDIDPKVVEVAKKENPEKTIYCGNVLDLELNDVDIVFAFDLLEHIVNVKQFVEKLSKIAKKYVILQVPVNRRLKPVIWKGHFDGHTHIFNRDSIEALFENHFKIKDLIQLGHKQTANGPEMFVIFEKV